MVQLVIFYVDFQRNDFHNSVDWDENRKMLRVYFRVDFLSDCVSYDIQNGVPLRSSHNNALWDLAQYEFCWHKFADISETGFGVALLDDCKYGYSCKRNTLGMSLIRSPKWPYTKADIGLHEFTYSLYSHKGNELSDVSKEGFSLNFPLKNYLPNKLEDCQSDSFIEIDETNVILDDLKLARMMQTNLL
ncbi:unnamed protein product [Moneuplotes crassus]|uniref:Glycosyl hydrolase family 38 C-terminal domain-containing protein n=1 Tax=Euplotes crassus TaxID=5936 RepID=A0AAD1XQ26_EUPCR|nr:unnamed protein product [Moneuplotes crassus]